MTMKQITEALTHIGPMSALELCAHLGIARMATLKQLRQLRDRQAIHIAHYERQPDGRRGRCTPFYALGDAPDAEPPVARSKSESARRHYAQSKALIAARKRRGRRTALGVWAGLA